MKKIFFVLVLLLAMQMDAVSVVAAEGEAIDYTKGWFDSNPGKFTVSDSKAVDNSSLTYVNVNENVPLEIEFIDEITIDILSFYVDSQSYNHKMDFYDANNNLLKTVSLALTYGDRQVRNIAVNLVGVKKMSINRSTSNNTRVYEVEIFERLAKEKISDVKIQNINHSSVSLSWKNPSDKDFEKIAIKIGEKVVATVDKNLEEYTLKGLDIDKEYEIELTAVYSDGTTSASEKVSFKTTKAPTVKGLQATDLTQSGATLKWENKVTDHTGVRIYRPDGTNFTLNKYTQLYKLSGLTAETEYQYGVALVFDDVVSERANITFKTKEPDRDVTQLVASATAENVDLKWKLPVYTSFEHAVIYRKEKAAIRLFSLFAADDFTPLFETNGTTFKDLTVAPDTSYTYKVTTVASTGDESEGKTVDVKTQKMSVSGGGTTVDENGNYVIRWEKPTTGKIKVLVGGVEYAIVPATDKKIVIPAEDMKFNFLGQPDVKLIPVDDQGKEGNPSTPGGGGGGSDGGGLGTIVGGGGTGILDVPNLLAAGVDLLTVVGPYLLLGLAFIVVPILISLIKKAWYRGRAKA